MTRWVRAPWSRPTTQRQPVAVTEPPTSSPARPIAISGLDGGNDGGKGITDTPGGLKLQAEGHDVRYRNIWITELDLKEPDTNF